MSWILDHLPWWVMVGGTGLAAMTAFVVLRSLGFTLRQALSAVAAIATLGILGGAYQKGRKAGVDSADDRQRRKTEGAIEAGRKIDSDAAARSPDKNREALRKWGRE